MHKIVHTMTTRRKILLQFTTSRNFYSSLNACPCEACISTSFRNDGLMIFCGSTSIVYFPARGVFTVAPYPTFPEPKIPVFQNSIIPIVSKANQAHLLDCQDNRVRFDFIMFSIDSYKDNLCFPCSVSCRNLKGIDAILCHHVTIVPIIIKHWIRCVEIST